ncbi:MAG: methyl-accepting chemotaxis protein [Vicinamibacterales bacterium]
MQNWTIRTRLLVAFGIGASITLVLGATGYYAASEGAAAVTEIGVVRLPSVESLLVMNEAMNAVAAGENALLAREASKAQRDDQYKEFDSAAARAAKARAIYEPLPQTVEEAETWKKFVPAWDAWWADHEAFVKLSRAFEASPTDANYHAMSAFAFDTLEKSNNTVDGLLDKLQDINVTVAADTTTDATSKTAMLKTVALVGALAGLVVAVALGLFTSHSLNKVLVASTRELREGTRQIVAASSQVAMSATALSQGATEQAASIEETSASMEEMASMTRQNADNANRGAALVEQSGEEFARCESALKDMVQSTDAILDSSQKVGRILKTIDEIAFQTNILALNAAVEAARAGEAGMGFAVVADEVRNLAQRAAASARDTATLIDEATANASAGTEKVQALGEAIERLGRQSAELKQIVLEVSSASAQQAQGLDQVTQAVAQMEKVTQSTAATAEESAAASEELNAQAEASQAVVVQLERLVGGAAAADAGDVAVAADHPPARHQMSHPTRRAA